ncbi:MAG: hypothetical protein KME21_29805 [Desmonostoc vinosum HA7617-LM4]|nr:hypothetical protein [Desmonostoc vinosum HA7617-LM4]
MQFQDGSEQCINFPNTEERIARSGHFLTLLIARNLQIKDSLYVAFLNHATRDFYHFQRAAWKRLAWKRLLWGKKSQAVLGYATILGLILSFFYTKFFQLEKIQQIALTNEIQQISTTWNLPTNLVSVIILTLLSGIILVPGSIIFTSNLIGQQSDKVNKLFGNQIDEIMKSLREQVTTR